MKQWNGLLKKEWVTMKWPLLVSALFGILVMSFFPLLITRIFGLEVHVFQIALIICFVWVIASALAPVTALFTMLEREMKRPDVWLHSTASIYKLVGAKALLASLIGVVVLLIPTIVLAVQYTLFKSTTITFNDLFFFGSIFIVLVFAVSIIFMSIGFFFWVIDRLMKPLLKGYSIVATLILFFISFRIYSLFTLSEFYKKGLSIGPVDVMKLKNPLIDVEFIYFEHMDILFYSGEILFNVFCTVAMFIVAAVLFEKKVRL
jgi:hypothetical protein